MSSSHSSRPLVRAQLSHAHPGATPQVMAQTVPGPSHASSGKPHPGLNATDILKKKRPLDKELPKDIEGFAPEASLYHRLLTLEKILDYKMTKKNLDIQESLFSPTRIKRTLRLYLSHTVSDQVWQQQQQQQQSMSMGQTTDLRVPNWSFRIEGYLLDPSMAPSHAPASNSSQAKLVSKKFSTFIKSLVVTLDRDPSLYAESSTLEWIKSPLSQPTDGFEIKRAGDETALGISVHIKPDCLIEKWTSSVEGLRQLIGLDATGDSKANILLALVRYIHKENCLSVDDGQIVCDAQLKQIFGTERFAFSNLPERVALLLVPPEPIVLHYTLDAGKEYKKCAKYFDLVVDCPLTPAPKASMNLLKEISFLDQKISEMVHFIIANYRKRQYLLEFIEQPSQVMLHWMDEIASNSPEQSAFEKSQSFRGPWTAEAIYQYLNSRA